MAKRLLIGNAGGFWGDSIDAPLRLLQQQPDLDYLTIDYLAELSMSIMAIQRERDPNAGYARDFLEVIRSLIPLFQQKTRVKIITNAGGLHPHGCASACAALLRDAGCHHVRIGVIAGDDVLPQLRSPEDNVQFDQLDTGEPLSLVRDRLITANAYLGAKPIVEALGGTQIVITGRVADPSLTVAPCVYHFGWDWKDYNRLAGATVAGHLIECGTQVTGGIATHWLELPDQAHIGFPIVEVESDGSCVVTKPAGTGGEVSERTVKEQLLYEIGDPARYLSPDATVSFLTLSVAQVGPNRVAVRGATGSAPPPKYKVSACYRDGYRADGMLAIYGRDALDKARRCGEIVHQRLVDAGCEPQRWLAECLGAGDLVPGLSRAAPPEVILRLSAADNRREVVERFTKELAPLVTSGPQGVSGYATGRPKVRPVFGYWPCLIDRKLVIPNVTVVQLESKYVS